MRRLLGIRSGLVSEGSPEDVSLPLCRFPDSLRQRRSDAACTAAGDGGIMSGVSRYAGSWSCIVSCELKTVTEV